jgi:hypothetical protein
MYYILTQSTLTISLRQILILWSPQNFSFRFEHGVFRTLYLSKRGPNESWAFLFSGRFLARDVTSRGTFYHRTFQHVGGIALGRFTLVHCVAASNERAVVCWLSPLGCLIWEQNGGLRFDKSRYYFTLVKSTLAD